MAPPAQPRSAASCSYHPTHPDSSPLCSSHLLCIPPSAYDVSHMCDTHCVQHTPCACTPSVQSALRPQHTLLMCCTPTGTPRPPLNDCSLQWHLQLPLQSCTVMSHMYVSQEAALGDKQASQSLLLPQPPLPQMGRVTGAGRGAGPVPILTADRGPLALLPGVLGHRLRLATLALHTQPHSLAESSLTV